MQRLVARLAVGLPAVVATLVVTSGALAASSSITISQVYGGGGNSGATFKNDFIELYNLSNASVNLTGWSVQYAASTGTTWQVTNVAGSLAPGAHYLVQEQAGAGGTTALPTPNATGNIAMAAGAGKVALVSVQTALVGMCPTGVVDLVGYGAANCFEGAAAAPALSNTTAALRGAAGATDTDNNFADFTAGAPTPRTGDGGDAAPSVASTVPADGAAGPIPPPTSS